MIVRIGLAVCLSACGVSQQRTNTVIVSEGCMVYVDGLTLTQTQELLRTWSFDDGCKIEISTAIEAVKEAVE